MKKTLSLLLSAAFLAALAGCAPAASSAPASLSASASPATASSLPASSPAASAPAAESDKPMPETIPGEDFDPEGGADAYAGGGNNPASRYYVNPDFYHMQSDENLTLIEGFKTMQQTTEWSCGNVTALMVLNHYGVNDVSEYDIAVAMGSHTDKDVPGAQPGSANNPGEFGTNVQQMTEYFAGRDDFTVLESSYLTDYSPDNLLSAEDGVTEADQGNLPPTFSSAALYASENDDATEMWVEDAKDSYFVQWLLGHLEAGRPIMVEWGDWDGHWQAIIGYDSNGTPSIGDDILIFADPYDSSDHWQDGYYYYPLERWFYMWQDRAVAPKPYQLQPYLVVEKTGL